MDIGADQVGEVMVLARQMTEQFAGAEEQFEGLIEGLDEDERADLVALLWIGRGDFEPEEWAEARRVALEEATTPTADYLKATDHLSDHLEAGLEAMGGSPRDAEDDANEG